MGQSAENLLAIEDPGFLDASEVHDDGDYAQHQQLREQAAIHERARQMARLETHPDFDGEHCLDCDIEIPESRLKLGKIRCVDCQQLLEDREKRHSLTHVSWPRYPEDW